MKRPKLVIYKRDPAGLGSPCSFRSRFLRSMLHDVRGAGKGHMHRQCKERWQGKSFPLTIFFPYVQEQFTTTSKNGYGQGLFAE